MQRSFRFIRTFSSRPAVRTAADQNDKASKSPAFKKADQKAQQAAFDQDPAMSNVTASQSSPQATQEYVKGNPDPSSYREGYETVSEEDRKDAPNTQWSPSSTSTAPSHRALAEDVKAREASDMPLEGAMPGKIPPDFNTEHIGQKGPDWPGKKEEMKEQGSFDKRKASY